MRGIAAPHLIAFNRAHGRTTHLSELAGTEVVYIDKLESHDHVRMASRIGLRAPVHSTAAGKVLLADLPRDELDAILADLDASRASPRTRSPTGTPSWPSWPPCASRAGRTTARRTSRRSTASAPRCAARPDARWPRCRYRCPTSWPATTQLLDLLPALLEVTERISRDCGWQPATTSGPKGLPA